MADTEIISAALGWEGGAFVPPLKENTPGQTAQPTTSVSIIR